jgi:hypothetical protein
MHRQTPTIYIVRFLAQQIEKLRVAKGYEEVEGIVCVGHDDKQRGFLVAQRVELQLVIGRQIAQLLDIERGEARAAGDQDAFGGLS